MVQALTMQHDLDPREELARKLGDITQLELFHNQILVAIYVRPEKTKSGLIITDNQRKEDEHQGKVGMVIAMGPLAFKNDARNDFGDQKVQIGEWIAFRASDGFQLTIGKNLCRMLQDIDIKARIQSPDFIF